MVDTLPTPTKWRRFRRRQALLAAPFLLLATAGLLAAAAGELFGLAVLVLFGPVGLLCVLNACSARRGGGVSRLVTRHGPACFGVPGHRLGVVLLLVLVVVSFAIVVS